MNNVKSLKEIVKQLRSCGYTCEAGPLENNVDFQMLERIAGVEPERTLADSMEDARKAIMSAGNALCNLGKLAVRSPQEIRDDIIEQAKRDVAELVKWGTDTHKVDNTQGNLTYRHCHYLVSFEVNREKYTVVALIKRGFNIHNRRVAEKGIAKCAPDDCFNVHIGKAIALRRALGLEVPTEYLNAPQPTEVRVGDVIERTGTFEDTRGLRTITEIKARFKGKKSYKTVEGFGVTDEENVVRITDDSREEVAE